MGSIRPGPTLDLGWLAFTTTTTTTTTEIRDAMAAGPEQAAARIADRRWFHGLDKAYGGHAATPNDELGMAFAVWITEVRFHPAVVATRINTWYQQATDAAAEATRARPAN